MPILSLESLMDLEVGCKWIRKWLYDQSQRLSVLRGQGGRAPGLEAPGRQFIQGRHHTQRSKPRKKLYPGKGFTREGTICRESAAPREVTIPKEGIYPRKVPYPWRALYIGKRWQLLYLSYPRVLCRWIPNTPVT